MKKAINCKGYIILTSTITEHLDGTQLFVCETEKFNKSV